MFLLQSDELLEHVNSVIHEDTQQHKFHFDLTVSEIQRFEEAGSLDFGGSEFVPSKTMTITPQKKNPDDDYGWWNLKEGTYRAIFNESIQNIKDTLAAISPLKRVRETGIISNTILLTARDDLEELSMVFQVPKPGCNIKENARFAKLLILAD